MLRMKVDVDFFNTGLSGCQLICAWTRESYVSKVASQLWELVVARGQLRPEGTALLGSVPRFWFYKMPLQHKRFPVAMAAQCGVRAVRA